MEKLPSGSTPTVSPQSPCLSRCIIAHYYGDLRFFHAPAFHSFSPLPGPEQLSEGEMDEAGFHDLRSCFPNSNTAEIEPYALRQEHLVLRLR